MNTNGATSTADDLMQAEADVNGTSVRLRGENSWHPLSRRKLLPVERRYDSVEITTDLLTVSYLRLVLQFAALNCELGGSLIFRAVTGRTKPVIDAVRQEISLVLGPAVEKRAETRDGRGGNEYRLVYVKVAALPLESYRNASLALGVITSGRDLPALRRCLESFSPVRGLFDEAFVCGPDTVGAAIADFPWVRLLPLAENPVDPRPAICRKKNQIARTAMTENLLIVHERIRPMAGFAEVFRALNPCFEVAGCELRDLHGELISGWNFIVGHDHIGATRLGTVIANVKYNSPLHYANGSVILCKRDVYLRHPLDERLHWGEMEDNHWYQKLWHEGVAVTPVAGLLCSEFSASLTTVKRSNWRPSGYKLWHRWMPQRQHSLGEYLVLVACLMVRFFVRNIVFFFWSADRGARPSSKGQSKRS